MTHGLGTVRYMPTTTEVDKARNGSDFNEAIDQSRADLRESIDRSQGVATALARSVADTVRIVVPGALLRPAESMELVFEVVEGMLRVERELLHELFRQFNVTVEGATERSDRKAAA